MDDPIGQAIKDYFESGQAPEILVDSNYTADETIPPAWFFRNFEEMPAIEKTALDGCHGKILDVGAGAGCHSLYLQKNGFNVTALEKSELAAGVMKKRDVKNIVVADLNDFKNEEFDTILVLMNGTGIAGTISGLNKMLDHLKSLLNSNGQILIDSSDIRYLFEEDDGSFWVDLTRNRYYGEMDYEVKYKNHYAQFSWLFADFEKLNEIAESVGLKCNLVKEGEHYDYLAKLTF
jgi:SAM-dependent methyltransferase